MRVEILRRTNLNPVHDFGKLELESDFQKSPVLANGIGDPGLDSVSAKYM